MRIIVIDCVDVDSKNGGDEGEIDGYGEVECLEVLISDGQTNIDDYRVAFATENQITLI